jgi:hypothetical protein
VRAVHGDRADLAALRVDDLPRGLVAVERGEPFEQRAGEDQRVALAASV